MKRGQSAMEFLMTYGWAILIVLVVLSVLYFLGVFSPKVPNTCIIQAPFVCRDIKISENSVTLALGTNTNIIESATVNDIMINGQSCTALSGFLSNNVITSSQQEVKCLGLNLNENSKTSVSFDLSYNTKNGVSHDISGQGNGIVEAFFFEDLPYLDNLIFGWAGNSSYDYVNAISGALNGGLIAGNYLSGFFDNNATLFDGNNDYISYGDVNVLDFGSNSFSVSFWINTSRGLNPNNEFGIVNKNSGYQQSPGWGMEISTWGGLQNQYGIAFYITSQTNWGNTNVYSGILDSGNLYHVVAVRNGTTNYLYINGNLVNSKTHNEVDDSVNNAQSFIIGDHSWGPNFKGVLDEIVIWGKALSPSEISNLYNYYN